MKQRPLGKSGLSVSALGFGCGAVGGILVRGSRAEMIGAVARAIDLGVTYFDTAPVYGAGLSETNLGTALREVGVDVVVGTKVRLAAGDFSDIEAAVVRSVEASLKRLGREHVELIQLHNFVAGSSARGNEWVSVADAARAVNAFARLREQGKVGAYGINALGDMESVHRCLKLGIASAQVCINLLNPTAGIAQPAGFPFQNQSGLIERATAAGVGVLAIRVLAGGALSGSGDRHANAAREVDPIASGQDFAADVQLAQRFGFLLESGHAESLAEAAVRFAVFRPGIASAVIGISTLSQLELAVRAAAKGPLPAAANEQLAATWAGFARGPAQQLPA